MNEVTRIFLKSKEETEILQGFPWVFDNEIAFIKWYSKETQGIKQTSLNDCQAEDGTIVEVYEKSGAFLGSGVINKKSKITVRIIGKEHADKILENIYEFISKKIRDAVNIRKLNYSDADSYRLIFAEADLLPGLIAERYCDKSGKVYIVIQFLALACEIFRDEILKAIEDTVKPYAVYERSDVDVRKKEGLEETAGWIGKAGETKIHIIENGIELEVDIANGQKTGYFLDQKFNRREIQKFCKGKKVLDTFTHTGAFGLNAVKGGAREVISVDISPEAVETVNTNIKLNHAENKMTAVCADVFDVLKKYEAEEEKFDLIILDPPAFTKSARQIQKAYGGYKEN